MPEVLLDQMANPSTGKATNGFAIEPGIVTNNIDLIGQGRVQVKIPARPSFEPWARISAVGASGSRGFMWVPQVGDEVLVAFADNDTSSAYILGGLWSAMNLPPLSLPTDTLTKRTIKTGATEALGHTLEFDDAKQSITITTSTDQKISMDPLSIELTNLAGSVSIKMDNTSQAVSITAVNKIELKAIDISMTGSKIEMTAAEVSITSAGPCSLVGLPIKLN